LALRKRSDKDENEKRTAVPLAFAQLRHKRQMKNEKRTAGPLAAGYKLRYGLWA